MCLFAGEETSSKTEGATGGYATPDEKPPPVPSRRIHSGRSIFYQSFIKSSFSVIVFGSMLTNR